MHRADFMSLMNNLLAHFELAILKHITEVNDLLDLLQILCQKLLHSRLPELIHVMALRHQNTLSSFKRCVQHVLLGGALVDIGEEGKRGVISRGYILRGVDHLARSHLWLWRL